MWTRSKVAGSVRPSPGLAAIAMLALALAAGNAAHAQEVAAGAQISTAALLATVQVVDPAEAGVTVAPATVTGGLNLPDPELWDGFRHSVSDAAASSCFDPHALAHEGLAVQGLLRLPFLVQAAAASACR